MREMRNFMDSVSGFILFGAFFFLVSSEGGIKHVMLKRIKKQQVRDGFDSFLRFGAAKS